MDEEQVVEGWKYSIGNLYQIVNAEFERTIWAWKLCLELKVLFGLSFDKSKTAEVWWPDDLF